MPVAQNNSLKFLAQAFSVDNPGEATGVYLTQIGLYFKKKGNASSVRLSLLEMKNGVPDRNSVLPNSTVSLDSSDIVTSDDSLSETRFLFPQPVFVEAGKQYCFAIQSPSPDFTVWGATRGERDVSTNKVVNNNPLTESAFYSESNAEYSELPNQDIKFTLYRAKFNKGAVGTAVLRNKENLDYLVLAETTIIENLVGYTTDKIYNLFAPDTQKASFVDMFKTDDGKYVLVVDTVDGASFAIDERIVMYRETVANGQTYRVELLSAKIEKLPVYEYHSVFPRLNVEKKAGSEMTMSLTGVKSIGDSYDVDDVEVPISEYAEKVFSDKPRYLLGFSKENILIPGSSSVELTANLYTTNEYVAPIVRFDSSQLVLLTNIINNDITNETTRDGLANSKYVSRIVTLADGMDAEDIKVYVDAYKPKNTEVRVYGKFQNAEDFSSFDDLKWIELTQVTPNVYSDPKDQTDYREYEFEIPADYKTSDGYFAYVGSGLNSGTYIRFKKYSIKIVLTTETGYEFNPPKITDLRVIALQK